jgi:hypothetical protein
MYYPLISSMNKVVPSYLLDTYSGAIVGFDFRKIKTTAIKCIRIRRSSDNTEMDIGFFGNIIDNSAITIFVGSNSAYVVKWYDQSGNGYDLSQTTAAYQPRIVNAGTIYTQNGKVSMEYYGSDKHLVSSYSFSALIPVHAFLTVKNTRDTSLNPYLLDSSLSRFVIYFQTFISLYNGLQITSSYSGSDFNIVTGLFNGTSSKLRRNGNEIASGNAGTWGLSGVLYVGCRNNGAQNMDGSYSSLVIYNSDKTSNQSAIETEINNYYGIY